MGFRTQPYDVSSAYGRIGSAAQDVVEAPIKALEIIENLKTKRLNRELTEEELKKYKNEIEQGKLSKETQDALLKDFIDTYDGAYENIEGPPTPETATLKSKMSEKQFFDTVTALSNAIDDKDDAKFGRIMNNVTTLLQSDMPNPSDYGGSIALNQWSASNLDKEGYLDKVGKMNTKQITAFFDNGLPDVLKEYESSLPEGQSPTEGGAIKFMLNNPQYANIPQSQMVNSKGWKDTIKELYPSEKDVSQEQRKQRKEATAAETKKTKDQVAVDNAITEMKENAIKSEKKATSLSRKAAFRADQLAANALEKGGYVNMKTFSDAHRNMMDDKKQKEAIEAQASAQIILEKIGSDHSEEAYDLIIEDNGGPLPGIKNYDQWLTEIDENRPVEEVKGFGERLSDVGTSIKEVFSPTEKITAQPRTQTNTIKRKARDKKTGNIIWVLVDKDTNQIVQRLGKVQ
jgi:hypothetical protein